MKSLFEPEDRNAILTRIAALQAGSQRAWGKMDPAQMMCHCAIAMETGTGDRPMKQKFIGRILMPFFRSSILGQKPFSRNSPTDPTFVVADPRDFEAERKRLVGLIGRMIDRGEETASKQIHPFFGKMTGREWGELMYKHLDHHLQQFGG